MEYVKGEEGRKDAISKLSTLLTKSTVAQEVSSSTEYWQSDPVCEFQADEKRQGSNLHRIALCLWLP